ncbi:MAG: RnfABCDGE type electron transport complex subunit B [Ruminococcaceae bacterium]|nr:RnfABCDGE type electron transport complex subunit B [Oscillospiraceae bacterium]
MTEILIPVLIVGVIGLVAGVGLSLAAKFMAVPVDETQEKLSEALPGANCGSCGYSGCDGYAAALAAGEATPDKCSPGGAETAAKLAEILGVEAGKIKPLVAYIACKGNAENSVLKYEYSGFKSCTAASLIHSGPLSCAYGCIGFGDCMRVCQFGAITLIDGRPVINEELCASCGKCVSACPKGLISLIPKDAAVRVGCGNKAKGAAVAKACKVSCLSCMQCEKNCPVGAVKVENNIAVIDYEKCTSCGKCKEVCKRGVIQ